MVFVWRLQEVRLLWAFTLVHRTKENVLSCLQSVVADLNTLTGGQQVGLCKVNSANCVWTIREEKPHMVSRGSHWEWSLHINAYVDNLIAVGQQEQVDGMKASLDALYTMKTSGTVPAEYNPGSEPLKFLGCFIERRSKGEIVMHQRSYIEHCLRNNDMLQLKAAKGLPCVDEKSPPEDAYDEDGYPTSFEEDKSMCQKYIGQLDTARYCSYFGHSGLPNNDKTDLYQGLPY